MGAFVVEPRWEAATLGREALACADTLYNLARYLTRNATDAEDLVQETYTRALRAASQFTPGTNLKAWVFRILRNTFISVYRRQRHDPTVGGLDTVNSGQHNATAGEWLRGDRELDGLCGAARARPSTRSATSLPSTRSVGRGHRRRVPAALRNGSTTRPGRSPPTPLHSRRGARRAEVRPSRRPPRESSRPLDDEKTDRFHPDLESFMFDRPTARIVSAGAAVTREREPMRGEMKSGSRHVL